MRRGSPSFSSRSGYSSKFQFLSRVIVNCDPIFILAFYSVLFSSEAKRAASLGKVRALLKKYDPIPVSPELKNYGDEGSREAQQYFLLDENIPAACPFSKLSPSSAAL